MTILGTPCRMGPDAPKITRRSLSKATVRKDMSAISSKKAAELLTTYASVITRATSGYDLSRSMGLDNEDLVAIARIAVLEAYVRYRADSKASLNTWVNQLVKWRVSEAVTIAFRGGREHLGNGVRPTGATEAQLETPQERSLKQTRTLQWQWLQVVLRKHFTVAERDLLLGRTPTPENRRARNRLKWRRHKVREKLMQIAVEAGVITRDRPEPGRHYVVALTDDVPFAG